MPYQLTLSDKQAEIVAEALEYYSRFLWGQVHRLPLSLEGSARMRHIFPDEVEEVLLPFRRLVWPYLRGWGHSFGVGYAEGQLERQAAQISYELYKTILAASNAARGKVNVHSGQPLHYSPEPLPAVEWVGEAPAAGTTPAQGEAPKF